MLSISTCLTENITVSTVWRDHQVGATAKIVAAKEKAEAKRLEMKSLIAILL